VIRAEEGEHSFASNAYREKYAVSPLPESNAPETTLTSAPMNHRKRAVGPLRVRLGHRSLFAVPAIV
jgi:hypothetical protein